MIKKFNSDVWSFEPVDVTEDARVSVKGTLAAFVRIKIASGDKGTLRHMQITEREGVTSSD